MNYFKLLFLPFLLLIVGCAPKAEMLFPKLSSSNLQINQFNDLPHWNEDNHTLALQVFNRSCHLHKSPSVLKSLCQKALQAKDAKHFFESNFRPYQLFNKTLEKQGLITGYYEPSLQGSLSKHNEYKYPVYAVPHDLITVNLNKLYPTLKPYRLRGKIINQVLKPYYNREEIENNTMKAEVLCYVNDPIALFFLHIQGSGKVFLENGEILNIGYANQNGHKYFAIGKALIADGFIKKENISLQSIAHFLKENPDKMSHYMNLNASYIFFETRLKSACGSSGAQLHAKRSAAVDPKSIPLGMPLYLKTTDPIEGHSINQIMIAQDTGGAIKGEIRADFFWGNGEIAALKAGKMQQMGEIWILIPKDLDE
jgi:membrane-bound lytic murein transglycosylase A